MKISKMPSIRRIEFDGQHISNNALGVLKKLEITKWSQFRKYRECDLLRMGIGRWTVAELVEAARKAKLDRT
jgi:hypothetical protein